MSYQEDDGLFTNFHLEVVDAKGKQRHMFTRVGGGRLSPEGLIEHFKRHNRFSRAKSVKVTPIIGDHLPMTTIALMGQRPAVRDVVHPDYQAGDPVTHDDFHTQFAPKEVAINGGLIGQNASADGSMGQRSDAGNGPGRGETNQAVSLGASSQTGGSNNPVGPGGAAPPG